MVDNDITIRQLAVTALSYCVNRKVVSFEDPLDAWEYIQKGNAVDIVVADVDMPRMNGFELLAKVREKDPDKIFIIMSCVSAYAETSRIQGADAFLAKPFSINDLFEIVQCFVVDGQPFG